jgi:hypothetical protein
VLIAGDHNFLPETVNLWLEKKVSRRLLVASAENPSGNRNPESGIGLENSYFHPWYPAIRGKTSHDFKSPPIRFQTG